jgi:hypothetical protein
MKDCLKQVAYGGARFLREISFAARLQYPHILTSRGSDICDCRLSSRKPLLQ